MSSGRWTIDFTMVDQHCSVSNSSSNNRNRLQPLFFSSARASIVVLQDAREAQTIGRRSWCTDFCRRRWATSSHTKRNQERPTNSSSTKANLSKETPICEEDSPKTTSRRSSFEEDTAHGRTLPRRDAASYTFVGPGGPRDLHHNECYQPSGLSSGSGHRSKRHSRNSWKRCLD